MKLTAEGIAVIEGDNYLSNDIIVQKRLDVAKDFLEQFRPYIPVEGVVVDVGASLGDYTATFSDMVGPEGKVIAFEPHRQVFECLVWNMRLRENVWTYQVGLGESGSFEKCRVAVDTNNIGASRLERDPAGEVTIYPLDGCQLQNYGRLDFLKIDAEGWEPLILDGGSGLINTFRPAMLIEVNTWPLAKMNFTAEDIFSRLDALNYKFDRFDGPYADILCLPKERT
jgi:FkbM family methyltransferase